MSKKKRNPSHVDLDALRMEVEGAAHSVLTHQEQLNPLAALEALRKLEQFFVGYLHESKKRLMQLHIALGAVKMKERNLTTDVHTEHCCVIHGCKYGSDRCPVEHQEKWQSYPCEDCNQIEF